MKCFKAVHNRRYIEKHKRDNAVNVFNILEINVKNRKNKSDSRAENAKENDRNEGKKNIARKMQIGILHRVMVLDKEISHNNNENKQRNKEGYKCRKYIRNRIDVFRNIYLFQYGRAVSDAPHRTPSNTGNGAKAVRDKI